MFDPLLTSVRSFLKEHYTTGPLLLGLSGGADSTCLFHVLIECQKNFSFPLHVAHMDHNWRIKSKEEAVLLQELCEKHGAFFHKEKIENPPSKNKEDNA